jgi:hypothetical protein
LWNLFWKDKKQFLRFLRWSCEIKKYADLRKK